MKTSLHFKKKLLASLITASVVALAVGTPSISMAASADATLRGHASPSAVVTAKEIATGAVRRTKLPGGTAAGERKGLSGRRLLPLHGEQGKH